MGWRPSIFAKNRILTSDEWSDVEALARENDIRVIWADSEGNRLDQAGSVSTEHMTRLDKEQIQDIYEMAKENQGTLQISSKNGLQESEKNQPVVTPPDDSPREGIQNIFDIPENSRMETMILARILTDESGEETILIADSVITPVTATVHAIRIQLIYISVFMILLSLLMAFIVSFHISKPIIKISHTAKEISDGNLNIEFEEKGYKEISELADTLNYTVSELTKSELLQRELIANVSHDLRTPLTMITAYAEVMRDLPGENTPENLQVIIDEAKRLTELVNDLLDISKLQAGVQKLERKEYNLTESIKSVMKRYAKLVEQQGYDITFEYREPEVWVEADEYKIYQVLYNLVNNAVNYTGEDRKVIVRQIVKESSVRIEVTDTGEGIAPEQLNHVWDRYYKIDKNHKRAVMGTGLGLSIVKNILQLHDAPFGVITEIGKGSIFWFELKLKFSP